MRTYPDSPKTDTVDYYHGIAVPDPFRLLEDIESPLVEEWIARQNAFTDEYLSRISCRGAVRERMREVVAHDIWRLPRKHGDRYFVERQVCGQKHMALYWSEDLESEFHLLVDPGDFSTNDTVSLGAWSVSPDGNRVAFGVSISGCEWLDWRVRDIESGQDHPDVLRGIKSADVMWHPDGSGFLMSLIEEPSEGSKRVDAAIRFTIRHYSIEPERISSEAFYDRPDHPEWFFEYVRLSSCEQYVVISVWQGERREKGILIKDLRDPDAPVRELLTEFDASYMYVGNKGSVFYVVTDLDAPFSRLLAMDIDTQGPPTWREIIPESEDVLHAAYMVGNHFVVDYLHDAYHRIALHDLSGRKLRDVNLPGMGSTFGFSVVDDGEILFAYTDFTTPYTIFRLAVSTGDMETVYRRACAADLDQYETREVSFEGKDGMPLSMFICHRRGIDLDGSHPTYLFVHGHLHAVSPHLSSPNVVWREMGGILVFANLRGGAEYGATWYDAGLKQGKQDIVEDLFSAAEWLIANGYTSSSKLAVGGWSAGGKIVGAALVQRPDLFGACLPAIGVYDCLRFPKFTVGSAWISGMGSPDDPEEFSFLYKFSPYHSVKLGTRYPAVYITVADHDQRTFPGHSYKFAAALQEAQAGEKPILIDILRHQGHVGRSTATEMRERADRWTFLADVLNMDLSQVPWI